MTLQPQKKSQKKIRLIIFKFLQSLTNKCPRRCARTGGDSLKERGTFCPHPSVSGGLTLIGAKKSEKPNGHNMAENKNKNKNNAGLESTLERAQHER